MATPSSRPYVSRGEILQSPPLSFRIREFIRAIYSFLGLYIVTLLSLDPYTAAQNSRFNKTRKPEPRSVRNTSGGGGSGGGGGGGGGGGKWWRRGGGGGSGGGSGPSKRIGRVDDIRGPECGSCR